MKNLKIYLTLCIIISILAACSPSMPATMIYPTPVDEGETEIAVDMTPFPTRPAYQPGELVDYIAQTGDTLPALAARFNTTEDEIRKANPIIPEDASTMPPGMPMQIPIYYQSLWGTPFQMIPDAVFVNGPDATGFDATAFVAQSEGWIQSYTAWAFSGKRTAGEIVDYIGLNYSISPKVQLALLDYLGGAFTQPELAPVVERNILGLETNYWTGVYLQLSHAADLLNDSYYRWRKGDLLEFELADGSLVRPDPWQNAATVALQHFFSQTMETADFYRAIGPDGFSLTYQTLFGDPWEVEPHIPGSLQQPEMFLPFALDKSWAFTGGPHTGWGSMEPWTALDFAPPSTVSGCSPATVPTTAVADGLVVRDGNGLLLLDLDRDGDERTGWVVLYLHIAKEGRVPVGTQVRAGDPLGFPSCEGGRATGTHIHVARKYNGEWIEADGPVPFELSGWRPIRGDQPYRGWLVKGEMMVLASENPDGRSLIPIDPDG
ncbi:MAG: LysM peptidoglycan-binding domain-containing protein [Chloroflexi bacterium]|nr:LysM peptidoglycan-binding domain-containing protein [Chloroflexota bacterium]